jgi:hypothetical protein
MHKKIFSHVAVTLLVAGAAFLLLWLVSDLDLPLVREAGGTISAAGQRKPPAQNVGQSEEALRSLDLTGELDSGNGRPMRMRRITVQPGEMTYHQDGQPDRVVRAGDGFAEGRTTTHWGENTGKVPAVWIAVDIPKP